MGTKVEGNDSSDEDNYVYNVTLGMIQKSNTNEHPHFTVNINGHDVSVMADSGATVNIIDERSYFQMCPKPQLHHTDIKIHPYGQTNALQIMGKFTANITFGKAQTNDVMYVVKGSFGSLLSWKSSQQLGLINTTCHITHNTKNSIDSLLTEYSDLFTGLGKLRDMQVKLHIDSNVNPVAQPHRRIPFHVRKQVEEQLKRDEELGVIEKVEGATPWVSPLVVVPKPKSPGQIRICVDMRQANMAIKRERHLTPTINEIINDLNGATVFSRLDLNQGYNQLELEPSSRYITTFSTHNGLWRYKRLNFGVSSAAEVFQNAIRETLSGLSGVINMSDDILVFGKTQKEHDTNLRNVFQRLREKHLTLNASKCKYNKSTLEFFGHVFSKGGMSADPKKIDAIIKLDPPTDVSSVRSFLGMTNFCARYLPNYATLSEPLRRLTRKGEPWHWTSEQELALSKIRQALVAKQVMSYFDINKDTEILVDAGPLGLGAVLVQHEPSSDRKYVVAYASRALTQTEQRYSQTEREALAVIWACEHFHIYIYGKPVVIYTDHKPLVSLFGNPRAKPPARIERWSLRLQPYDAIIRYRAGFDNPADYLSRHPVGDRKVSSREEKIAEEYINYISVNGIPKAMSLKDVKRETIKDPTLQAVSSALQTGKWYKYKHAAEVNSELFQLFERVKSELTVAGDILLKGSKLVLPETLHHQAVVLGHEGHQGIVKTKALIREKVWFPGLDKAVDEMVKSCLACQASTPQTKREPLKMSPLPKAPWTELSADFGQLPNGDYILVIIDDYSRFPIVEVLSSTSARSVIPRFDRVFSEYGIPNVLRTDNGPPFNGNDFRQFANELGFHHHKITPYWPRANGEVERYMKTIKRIIKAALLEKKNWKQEMYKFLRNYRATPHSTTGHAPATLLFSRPMKTKLPELDKPVENRNVELRDKLYKAKMKTYADNKAYVKPSDLKVGDSVLIKHPSVKRKSDVPYDTETYKVIKQKGSMLTAQKGEHNVTRNSSFFKGVDTPKDNQTFNDKRDILSDRLSSRDCSESLTKQPSQGENSISHDQCADNTSVPEAAARIPRYPRREHKPPKWLLDYQT